MCVFHDNAGATYVKLAAKHFRRILRKMLKLCVNMFWEFWQTSVTHLSKHLPVLSAVSIDSVVVGWYGLESIFIEIFKLLSYLCLAWIVFFLSNLQAKEAKC